MAKVKFDQTLTIAMSVTDRHKSADWYGAMLGFELLFHADEVGWSEMQTSIPGVTIGFSEDTKAKAGNCVPVFGIADIDTSRAALEGDGVRFDGDTIVVEGMVKTATFYDPDDNALMLAENLMEGGT